MTRPNPGSEAARDLGCFCPIIDNHYGRRAPWPPDGWWIDVECPVHGNSDRSDQGGATPTDHQTETGNKSEA